MENRPAQPSADVTQMLLRWSQGDQQALDRLVPLVYDELKAIARARLRHERPDHTLNTTGLVHEAYLKLVDIQQVQWTDRAHFLAMASRQMRRVLVDYAARRRTAKRGGDRRKVALEDDLLLSDVQADALVELDDALGRLEAIRPRQSKAVELRFFGGLTLEETAEVLGVSAPTVLRDLRFAQAWLARAWSGTRTLFNLDEQPR